MRLAKFSILAFTYLVFATQTHASSDPRSISTSRQFIVYGPEVHLRGGVCDLAERVKRSALALLQKGDDWRTPIVIRARAPRADSPEISPASLHVSQTGTGLKIQLDLRIAPNPDRWVLERELLRAVFLELMYRDEPNTAVGTAYVEPPAWLLEGTLALANESESSTIAKMLGAPVASGDILPLDQLLRQQPGLLESPLRAIYRAYAAALVSMLTETPAGRARLARYVTDLPRSGNDPVADLKAHFPALGESAEQVEKIWTLSVVRQAASERYRLLASEETERQLAQVLHLEVREADGRATTYTLEEFPNFVRRPDSRRALASLAEVLLLLSARVNPLYRPVIAEYQEIAASLARGKTKKIPQRLAELRATREHISRRMAAIGDYMNWFEATQSRTSSGSFREYLDAAEVAEQQKRHRHDPISVYLDAFEAQIQN